VVVPDLFRGVLLDGIVSLSAEWRPTLGMKGLDRVCSTGFGEGAIIVGVVYVFSGRPAGPPSGGRDPVFLSWLGLGFGYLGLRCGYHRGLEPPVHLVAFRAASLKGKEMAADFDRSRSRSEVGEPSHLLPLGE
jgi:hypothetical protein